MIRAVQNWGKRRVLSMSLAALALAGCTGFVAGTDNSGRPSGAASTGTSAGGNGAVSLGGGSGGAGPALPPATDPGRVTMHRLNSAEYDNTMRDLLGTKTQPSVDYHFPDDDRGSDFDNTSDVLSVSPLHLSSYNTAATALISAALAAPAQRALLVSCDLASGGSACARSALEAFVPRAWRRAVASDEIDRLMAMISVATSHGDSTEAGFQLALRAALLSPNFIYRPELDPVPSSLTPHPLSDYELASRLSYFLWSSMPDDALLASAKAGNLHDSAVLAGHVARMVTDPKAQALVDNFAGQWLYIRLVDDAAPDPTMFPKFDADLRAAFKAETQLLFREVAFNGMPADQLLTAQFTFANDRLAQYYGLPAVGSTQPKRVDLTGNTQRRGFLSHGGFLTVNSHSDRTSPVLRGKYVLSELLCIDVPPPPNNVNTLIEPDSGGEKTLRQVLEQHVANPACASCHKLMDPIGFGMEAYDAVGVYRTTDGKLPVDTTGVLPTGEPFTSLEDMAAIIAKNPAFPKCMATKLYTYALGRSVVDDPTHMDTPSLARIASTFVSKGLKFQDLISGVVASPTFMNRRGDGG